MQVITTRKFDERLETIEAVRSAGISVCSGGIIGLGENDGDRVGLIWEMSQCVLFPFFLLTTLSSLFILPSRALFSFPSSLD